MDQMVPKSIGEIPDNHDRRATLAISAADICFISHKVNAQMYVELLNDALLDFAEDIYGESWTFQQDNASIHSAKFTKQFFASKNVPLLEWPAVSPDLNPVENLWSILSQQVYKNGRQFDTLKDLKEAIKEEWAKIDDSTLHSLIIIILCHLD